MTQTGYSIIPQTSGNNLGFILGSQTGMTCQQLFIFFPYKDANNPPMELRVTQCGTAFLEYSWGENTKSFLVYIFKVNGEGGSGLGTHVHPWRIHVDVWQNQYSIVK